VASALLIDDDVNLLASVKRAAELAHLDLATAATWDEGLGLFHVLSPNLVVADYNLPGSRHGLQLLAQIRRLRPAVRVILVSGYLDEADMDRVRALDLVDRALTKGSAVETAREIVGEVRAAQASANDPADWKGVADASLTAASVSEEALDELDAILRKKATGSDLETGATQ
jgi:ActR/RegA family two-component response regulator